MANINVNNNLIGVMYHNSEDTCHILYVLGSGYLRILLKTPLKPIILPKGRCWGGGGQIDPVCPTSCENFPLN